MKLKISKNSLWLCYSLSNLSSMNQMIPSSLEVAKVSPFERITPSEMLLFNAYELKCLPWMNGARVDIQTFARDKVTGTPHLVILDVLTNTRNWDPKNGITSPNYEAIINERPGIDLTFLGEKKFSVVGSPARIRKPNYTFIVEANKKCFFSTFENEYKMDFEEKEIMHPVTELSNLKIQNTCWTKFRGEFITAFKHNKPMQFNVHVNPLKLSQDKRKIE